MSSPDTVLEGLCRQGPLLVAVFSGLCVALLLTLVSAIAVEQGPATEVIIALNLVGIVPLIALFGAVIWRCRTIE